MAKKRKKYEEEDEDQRGIKIRKQNPHLRQVYVDQYRTYNQWIEYIQFRSI
jgi:hypothetical protein